MRCEKRCGPGGVRALGGGDAQGMHGKGPTEGCSGQGTRGAHQEHAPGNMRHMFVTLDVSKLSGWLNLKACRNISRMVVTLVVSRLSGWLNTLVVSNMLRMSVTLDVSKLSGWLKADSPCGVAANM